MIDNPEQSPKKRKFAWQFLSDRIVNRKGFLALVIIFLVALSLGLWLADIDLERQVRTYGYLGAFLVGLVSTMTILLPLPGEAVFAAAPGLMELETVGEISLLAFVASLGIMLGELTSYFAGLWGRAVIAQRYRTTYGRVDKWMRHYGGPAVFIFAFTPLPFDLVGIAAGSLRFPLWRFIFYCWVGRFARTLLVVHLGKIGWDVFFG